MTTITLQYNESQTGIKDMLYALLKTGLFKEVSEPNYNPEFVKKIKAAEAGPKNRLTPELEKKLFG